MEKFFFLVNGFFTQTMENLSLIARLVITDYLNS